MTTTCATDGCVDDLTDCATEEDQGLPTREEVDRDVAVKGASSTGKGARGGPAAWISALMSKAGACLGLWLSILALAACASAVEDIPRLDGGTCPAEVIFYPAACHVVTGLQRRCGGAWGATDAATACDSKASSTSFPCGAKACAHATASLRNVAWLGPRGGGEEAGRAWPWGRDSHEEHGKDRRAVVVASCGPTSHHGGWKMGVVCNAVDLMGKTRQAPTSAFAAIAALQICCYWEEGGVIHHPVTAIVDKNHPGGGGGRSLGGYGVRGRESSRDGDGITVVSRYRRRPVVDSTAAVAAAWGEGRHPRDDDAASKSVAPGGTTTGGGGGGGHDGRDRMDDNVWYDGGCWHDEEDDGSGDGPDAVGMGVGDRCYCDGALEQCGDDGYRRGRYDVESVAGDDEWNGGDGGDESDARDGADEGDGDDVHSINVDVSRAPLPIDFKGDTTRRTPRKTVHATTTLVREHCYGLDDLTWNRNGSRMWPTTMPLHQPLSSRWEASLPRFTKLRAQPSSSTWEASLPRLTKQRAQPRTSTREDGPSKCTKPLAQPRTPTWAACAWVVAVSEARGVVAAAVAATANWTLVYEIEGESGDGIRNLVPWSIAEAEASEGSSEKMIVGETRVTPIVLPGMVLSGSCRMAASRHLWRGCCRFKRALSPALGLLMSGGAEAAPPSGPAGSYTTSTNPPSLGRGCGGRRRCGVPEGGTWRRWTVEEVTSCGMPTGFLLMRFFVPLVALAAHCVLLVILHFAAKVTGLAVQGIANAIAGMRYFVTRRVSPGARRRRRCIRAMRAGIARVTQRRPMGSAPARIRATCRRIEAWLMIYLAITNHVLGNMHGGRRHTWRRKGYEAHASTPRWDDQAGAVAVRCEKFPGAVRLRFMENRSSCRPCPREEGKTVYSWTHASRVGEAGHPGPARPTVAAVGLLRRVCDRVRAAVSYPRPGEGSLSGAVAPGFERGAVPGRGQEAPRDGDVFRLRVEAVNSTGWRALQRRLIATEAQVILAQETWVTQDAVPAASAWAKRRGWQSVWAAAVPGPNGGASGGVAVLVRDGIGCHYPPGASHVIAPGRAVAAVVQAPGHRPTVYVSCYLCHGKGPCGENLDILAAVGQRMRSLPENVEYVIGGDLNMEPPDVASTGILDEIEATIMAPATTRGTFRGPRSSSLLDYFLTSSRIAAAIGDVRVVEAAGIRGHTPVLLEFKPRVTTLRALHLRKPPTIATERVFGPRGGGGGGRGGRGGGRGGGGRRARAPGAACS